jgi:hypothetical protein
VTLTFTPIDTFARVQVRLTGTGEPDSGMVMYRFMGPGYRYSSRTHEQGRLAELSSGTISIQDAGLAIDLTTFPGLDASIGQIRSGTFGMTR